MTAKEYLNQGRRLDDLINSKTEELKKLNDLAENIPSPNYSGMPYPASKEVEPQYAKCSQKIVDLEQEIKSECAELIALKEEIGKTINAVKDKDERLLLSLRYIQFLSWEDIAEKMRFCVRHIYRIHAKALKNIKIPKL